MTCRTGGQFLRQNGLGRKREGRGELVPELGEGLRPLLLDAVMLLAGDAVGVRGDEPREDRLGLYDDEGRAPERQAAGHGPEHVVALAVAADVEEEHRARAGGEGERCVLEDVDDVDLS